MGAEQRNGQRVKAEGKGRGTDAMYWLLTRQDGIV